ncbi:MAG TPA: hypothetical protein VL485_31550 [Ktedonobacteraceae bacterium]|jgi:hypothetical protein|nr:hypothetical protein [Ktedonobacteraceae bacterium]
MAWSSLVGAGAAKAVDFVAEKCGADKETRQVLKAGANLIAGGTTALVTGDVIGGGMVVANTVMQAQGKNVHSSVKVAATAVNLLTGSIDPDSLSTLAEASSTSVSTAADYWSSTQ